MKVRAVVGPLVSGSTYRRGVHLLLGGVLLLPYVLVGVAFVQLLQSEAPRVLGLLLLAVTLVIAVTPAFLQATRTLETVAARALLGVELPDPPAGKPALETRLRGAVWFALHLVTGGAVGFALLAAVPMALAFISAQLGIGTEALAEFQLGPLDEDDTPWLSLLGIVILVGVAYAVAGLGALAALLAPVLLGPSPTERIAALEAAAGELAERNRLARELHDSVGHALTVTTLQAAAAREVLDRDPEFVRRALDSVEEAGRAALTDLDYVLGLLRDGDGASVVPARTLAELDHLVAEARAAGAELTVHVAAPLDDVPAVVSREGYRIVQESLTNAARHAAGTPVSLRVATTEDMLVIEVVNPLREAPAPSPRGRGLDGMRERVSLLGGRMSAGPEGTKWRIAVRLPYRGRRLRGRS